MRAIIDTIFSPLLNWLIGINQSIQDMSVPLARPINVSDYFGVFAHFGAGWTSFVTTICTLAFIYGMCFIVVTQIGLLIKFKDVIKWW
jgi:hypothetical protein